MESKPIIVSFDEASSGNLYVQCNIKKNTSITAVLNAATVSTPIEEYCSIPSQYPFQVQLKNKAIPGSLSILAVPYVGIGIKDFNKISLGKTLDGINEYTFDLPFELNENYCNVFVGDDELKFGSDFNCFRISGNQIHINISIATVSRGKTKGIKLERGLADKRKITTPANRINKDIYITMPSMQTESNKGKAKLLYSSDMSKQTTSIYRYSDSEGNGLSELNGTIHIPAGSSFVELPSDVDIVPKSVVFKFGKKITNKSRLFDTEDGYYVDYQNNMLYLSQPYSVPLSVNFRYYDGRYLTENEYQYIDANTISFSNMASFNYKISYNMAVKVSENDYKISQTGDNIIFSDKYIMSALFGKTTQYSDKQLKVEYKYSKNVNDDLSQIANYITPIIYGFEVNYIDGVK